MIVMEKWYSVAELAEETGIPEPSLRRYLARFSIYVVSKGGKRAKKYDPTTIELLNRVKSLYDAGYETEGIKKLIKNEFPVIMSDKENEKTEENPNLPALATAEDVAEIKQALAEQKEFNKLLIQRLTEQERFIRETLESRDQLLLEKLSTKEEEQEKEEIQILTEEKPRGFFKRLFKK